MKKSGICLIKFNTKVHKEVVGLENRVLEVEAAGGRQDRESTQQDASAQLRPAAVHHGHLETENKPTAGVLGKCLLQPR